MEPIKVQLEKMRAKLPSYTPEQLEAARRKVASANSICRVDCEICGGIGWVKGEDGHLQVCPNVDPFTLYSPARFGLADDERDLSWADVDPVNNTLEAVEAVQVALLRGGGWVYLWGDYGVGKTIVLKTAVASVLRSHKMAGYTRMVEILDNLRGAYSKDAPEGEAQARLEWWTRLPLLAIDEFDRVNETEWATERRFLLMDSRYTQGIRGETVTLIASNKDPKDLEGYLYDRIRDKRFTTVKVTGKSYRLGAEWEPR